MTQDRSTAKRWLWFIGLWLASVTTLALVAFLIKLTL